MRTSRTTWVPEGRTRWRRFTAATTIVTALAAGLVYLTATGAIAVSLQISGVPFKLSATSLVGHDFVQYATVDVVSNTDDQPILPSASTQKVGGKVYDAATVTVLGDASIKDLHQTVCAALPGPLSQLPKNHLLVTIDAGQGEPASATNMVVDAPLLTATDATFTRIQIGADRALSMGASTPDGGFAQKADGVVINGLNQVAIGTTAGSFKLTGLSLGAAFTTSCE
jgi:hypothetical protein